MQYLTSLRLSGYVKLEPGVLGSLTQLQHLAISPKYRRGDTHNAGVRQWLHQLQHMQQLTLLRIEGIVCEDGSASAASLSVLTASSKLQDLGVIECLLPAGVWQHVFPAGRQLPHLQKLEIYHVSEYLGTVVTAEGPEGTRLVTCCPGLQHLSMHVQDQQYSAELLAALQGLSALRTLLLFAHYSGGGDCLQAVIGLTRLRELSLDVQRSKAVEGQPAEELLLHSTQLQQLTKLVFLGSLSTWSGGDVLIFEVRWA